MSPPMRGDVAFKAGPYDCILQTIKWEVIRPIFTMWSTGDPRQHPVK